MKKIILMKPAEKFLNKQQDQVARRVLLAIYHLPKGQVAKMQGEDNLFRLRVADVRVLQMCACCRCARVV
ncbi:MAG: type II toxin-antitoxin system RelE/ParE family toxin [Oscillospiraceae bacterium]|nr:type II toxin-antitoxin system RelE/ParE family toxin [Oscillospiraceae bacterium]